MTLVTIGVTVPDSAVIGEAMATVAVCPTIGWYLAGCVDEGSRLKVEGLRS